MTKEEVIAEIVYHDSGGLIIDSAGNSASFMASNDVKLLIDKIFDDFESRTCENCKHWDEDDTGYGYKLGYCEKDVGNGFTIDNVTQHSFGCNRWEQKEE